MEFYKIENGWMTNCYPDVLMKENRMLLIEIKKVIMIDWYQNSLKIVQCNVKTSSSARIVLGATV